MEERTEVAQACSLGVELEPTVLVDEMNDEVMKAYNALPERLYLVDSRGQVAYQGGIGPVMFMPEEWERAIADHLAGAEAA